MNEPVKVSADEVVPYLMDRIAALSMEVASLQAYVRRLTVDAPEEPQEELIA